MRRTSMLPVLSLLLAIACGPPKPDPTPPQDESVGPPTPKDPVEHAAQLIAQGKIDDAGKVIDDAMKEQPENHELWFSKGVVAQERGQVEEAVAAWTKTLELSPGFVPALSGLGAVALAKEAYAEAESHFRAAIAADPEFVPAHYNLAIALLGQGKPGTPRRRCPPRTPSIPRTSTC